MRSVKSFIRNAYKLALSVLLPACATPLFGQWAEPLHGTVNIIIANRNGLVAETDSRLSGSTGAVDVGQKLFRIDDRTVCTIADFYSNPGPRFSGSHPYPTSTRVPMMIHKYLREMDGRMGSTIESKLAFLGEVFSFELTYIANANDAAQDGLEPRSSQITLAGYDDKALKIAHLDLVPSKGPGPISYHAENFTLTVVGDKLQNLVAGIPWVAKPILDTPTKLSPRDKLDPILGNYAEAMSRNQGKDLSLQDLQLLANELVRRTASAYPSVVGGKRQVALLSGGKIISFDEPVQPDDDAESMSTGMVTGIQVIGMAKETAIHVPATLSRPYLMIGADIDGLPQSLDNIIFTKSSFRNCILTYSGSPLALFDSSNKVTGCYLQLKPGADPNSPFVAKLRKDFPSLFEPHSLSRPSP